MRKIIKPISFLILLLISLGISGCSEDRQTKTTAKLTEEIINKLPENAQLVAESMTNTPMIFKASVDGVVYYIANGKILLNTPLSAGDTIRLNIWSRKLPPNTQVTINEKLAYHDPTSRWGDNRFYFVRNN